MENKNVELNMLDIDKCRVLKIIRVEININIKCKMIGYMLYTRLYARNYGEENTDYVDSIILNAINSVYPNSQFVCSTNILFEGNLERHIEHYTAGKNILNFHINIRPSSDIESLQIKEMCLDKYLFNLKLSLDSNSDSLIACVTRQILTLIPLKEYLSFGDKYKTFIEIK
jgi:hypothetical protein